MTRDGEGAARTGVRPEIQALRAAAVLAVVLYHLWPSRLPGGYVGVDIFFAISGFLIIGHLLRDVDRFGRVSLLDFWAKRARRLLPAALVVIIVTGVATVLFVPDVVWAQWFQELGASAVYAQNWLLAANAVDYLGADNKPSPTQHFWSLSVEEQFYIFWPIVIVVVLAISRAARSAHARRALGVVLAVLTVASFAASVYGVAEQPAQAYFVTQSRAWEFGLGGLLAYFFASPMAGRERTRSAVSWLGIAGVVATLVLYRPEIPFPGVAALAPVVATLAVIWAGAPAAVWSPSALYRLRPVQWLGDVSYSFYLWHWGPIVIVPLILGRDLDVGARAAIFAVTLLVAWASKRLIEDPFRRSGPLVHRPAFVSVGAALVATALVFGGCVAVNAQSGHRIAQEAKADAATVATSNCAGAMSMLDDADCPRPFAVTKLTNPGVARADIGKGVREVDDCKQYIAVAALVTCDIGDTVAPTKTLALVGDSHAGIFLEPLDLYGKAHHVKIVTYIKTWCSGTGGAGVFVQGGDKAIEKSCSDWGKSVIADIKADDDIDAVVFSNFTSAYLDLAKGSVGRTLKQTDFAKAFDELTDAGKKVVAIRDIPHSRASFVPDCVAKKLDTYDPCRYSKKKALLAQNDDPQLAAASAAAVPVVDLSDLFCTAKACHAVIGGLIVYFDNHHLTATFARTLAEPLGERITKALGSKK